VTAAGDVVGPRLLGGRYELGPVVARGGMGEIHRARDRKLVRDVAVKRLRVDLASHSSARRRFENEARSAASFSDRHVVTVFDVGTDEDGVPFLVMEWLPGPTFADEIAAGPVSPERVRRIGGQVLGALAAAHDHGVLHRDVKPSNILLDESGDAKLADFGIATTRDGVALTATGDVIDTLCYVAPERFRGEPATPASDVYGVGLVLYEALTGSRSFGHGSPAEVAYEVTHRRLAPLPDRHDLALARAVERATAPDPADRFASAREMQAAMGRDETVPTLPAGRPSIADIAFAPTVLDATMSTPTAVAPAGAATEAGQGRVTWPRSVAALVVLLVLCALAIVAAAAFDGRRGPSATTDATTTTTVSTTTSTASTSPPTTQPATPPPTAPIVSPSVAPAVTNGAPPAPHGPAPPGATNGNGRPGRGKGDRG
jgi:serine/threonine-protein kinase